MRHSVNRFPYSPLNLSHGLKLTKKVVLLISVAVLACLVIVCLEVRAGWAEVEVCDDICRQFDADFVYSATGKPIRRVEKPHGDTTRGCNYYTRYEPDYYKIGAGQTEPGGPFIAIVLDNLSIENQKKGARIFNRRVSTDPRIKMDHIIITQTKNDLIWSIDLIINPNRYVWTNQRNGALTNEELIEFAARIADRLQGRETLQIRKNPVEFKRLLLMKARTSSGGGKHRTGTIGEVVKDFFSLIDKNRPDLAVAMMDANEQTKAMWATNFKAIKSLKIQSIKTVYEDEWTLEDQIFKVELQIKLFSGGSAYGWTNGRNYRWVRLKKTGDRWMVHELANNPLILIIACP